MEPQRPTAHLPDRKPLQFSLRSMIGLVFVSAVQITAFQRNGVVVASLMAGVMLLTLAPAWMSKWRWRMVAWTWAAALTLPLLIYQSYGWTLPLFGAVQGMPDDFVLRPTEVAGLGIAMIGSALASCVLVSGTFFQRVICLPPGLLLLLLLYSIVTSFFV